MSEQQYYGNRCKDKPSKPAIKRYDPSSKIGTDSSGWMNESCQGEYVLYSDVEKLLHHMRG